MFDDRQFRHREMPDIPGDQDQGILHRYGRDESVGDTQGDSFYLVILAVLPRQAGRLVWNRVVRQSPKKLFHPGSFFRPDFRKNLRHSDRAIAGPSSINMLSV